ncbi:MAG: B12-binding domain-containing protein [Methanomassiliicoccales archaeon]
MSETNEQAILQKVADAVLKGKKTDCVAAANEAIAAGLKPYDILMNGCKKGMDIVGDMYQTKKLYLPQVLSSANAMYGAIDVLKPLMLGQKNAQSPGSVVIGVAEGDVHDIGKNIVRILLDGAGYTVYDLGRDVQLDNFINTTKINKVDVVACSTLMTTTLASIKDLMDTLREQGLDQKVGTIIGGAATNQHFADVIGAKAWGKDASEGLNKISELIKNQGA